MSERRQEPHAAEAKAELLARQRAPRRAAEDGEVDHYTNPSTWLRWTLECECWNVARNALIPK